ncbi:hypothetical protein [Novosphingobium guangzhouense]|uniref:Uncharacterized protein n=1 Tax=Novosphingobium guangzhouense TaxID=1850347 RepID=A0A2K2G2U0_9SPHN|nr:hypothetical protein [Novosphingobium guangzhouense]PNU05365.1 hypothetical protein A8V01_16400 [Novosphingobium guangzhouense]
MSQIDWNIYNATSDLKGGPLIVQDTSGPDCNIEPYTDENGNETLGGQIGYVLGYVLMLAFFLVGYFVISSN